METQSKPLEITKEFNNISRREALRFFLKLQSVLQKKELALTNGELDIVVLVLTMPENMKYNILRKRGRAWLIEEYKKEYNEELSYGYMQQIIKNLKTKGILDKDEFGEYCLHPKFVKLITTLKKNLIVNIKFNINEN